MIALAALFFVIAVAGWAAFFIRSTQLRERVALHEERLVSYKRVGTWYETRVAELEEETRNLAQQIVGSTGLPAVAMPRWPDQPQEEYAYDGTGLVRETLDRRDVS